MKKSFIVIGLGRFGIGIVKTLRELKSDVIAIDINSEAVEKASEYISHCAICDSTKKNALIELGVKNIDHAIVAIGNNLQASILTVLNLKELGVRQITVRIDSMEYKYVMERIGATDIIIPEISSAISLANQIVSDSFIDYYKVNKEYGMVKIVVSDDFEPKSLVEIDARNKFNINIIAIIRNDDFILPKANDEIKPHDVILVFGKGIMITSFDHFINK